jgi:hypothetical protein
MKTIIHNINKAFDHRIRLGIMSVLMVNESADFNMLKELLGATDGNLASHTKALESEHCNRKTIYWQKTQYQIQCNKRR